MRKPKTMWLDGTKIVPKDGQRILYPDGMEVKFGCFRNGQWITGGWPSGPVPWIPVPAAPKMGICARHDCRKNFYILSGHKKKFCSQSCAHLFAVRKSRGGKKESKYTESQELTQAYRLLYQTPISKTEEYRQRLEDVRNAEKKFREFQMGSL